MAVSKETNERRFLSQTIVPASIRKVGIPCAAVVVAVVVVVVVDAATGYAAAFAGPVASMEAVARPAVVEDPSAAVAEIQAVCSSSVGSATSVVFEGT